jgi:hypothetical protein
MTRGKSAKLVRTGAHGRKTDREPVAIPGTCTIDGRAEQQVLVTDLGTHGCRMHIGAVGVTKAQELILTLAGCDPIKGSLKWSKGGALGVRFAKPLSEALLETLCTEQSAANVVPFRS